MIGTDIDLAAQLLREGELVAIPTETVYGLAANGLDPLAVSKIFSAKGRPTFNPLILHISSVKDLVKYVKDVPEKARLLAETFWPGPLSLLLNKKDIVPDIVTAGLKTVVVRVPSHPLTQSLLNTLDFPLAAPSANIFKHISPTRAEHVQLSLGESISYILDGGKTSLGMESTIVAFEGESVSILRYGAISLEEIETIIGRVNIRLSTKDQPLSPGQLGKHYSSRKKMYMVSDVATAINKYRNKKISLISFGNAPYDQVANQYFLSKTANLQEAASNLFECMHNADADDSEIIISQEVPDRGIGRAINDRLKRASV